eukprot:9136048-Ditylum_brightwellii.AAC.1
MPPMSNNIDYENNYFEHPECTKIHGEPTTNTLINLQDEIRANAQTVDTILGGGANGHLGLVCNATTYATILGADPYIHPVNPDPLVTPGGATQLQIGQFRDQHAEALRLFQEVTNVKRTLINQIVQAMDLKYLKAVRNPVTN